MSNKSEIEHNNTKPGLCRKGGSWTHDKQGKLLEGPGKPKATAKETKKSTKEDDGSK